MENKTNQGALFILTTVFFFWGFIAAGNSVFIPFCKNYFSLDQFQSQLIDFAFYLAYYLGALSLFVFGSFTGKDLVGQWGYKKSIVYGLSFSALGALAMMLPDKVMAASDGGNTGISIGGYDSERNPFIYVDFACGTWGARPWADGLSGNSNLFANMATQSIEVCEAENPVEILAYEFVADKAGAGKFRGGAPYRRDYKLLEAEAVLQVRSDRKVFRPYGLYGGNPGASSSNIMNPEREARPLDSKLTMTMYAGEVLRHELAGGGGWGDPLERDPESVLRDVRNELVSMNSARDDYGVVIKSDGWGVDYKATQVLRAEIQKLRVGKTPAVLWQDWPRKDNKGADL